jgi:hypothetical protein
MRRMELLNWTGFEASFIGEIPRNGYDPSHDGFSSLAGKNSTFTG